MEINKPMAFIFILLTLSFNSFANDDEIKDLMNKYLKGVHSRDKSILRDVSTPKFYKSIEKNYLQSKIKQTNKFIPYGFDIKTNKANRDKDQFWVNIKDKKKSSYSDYWYIITKISGSFKISDMIHMEE
jgi:hypothetical protein